MFIRSLGSLLAVAKLASCLPIAPNATDSSPTSPPGYGSWSALPDITSNGASFPRQEHSVVAINTDLYVFGGIEPFNGVTYPTIANLQKYSTTSQMWTNLASGPVALNHANLAVVNGLIYVCGGLAVTTSSPTYWGQSGSCSAYNPSSNKWTVLPDMPPARAVGSAATMVLGNVIYFAGGLKYTNLTNDAEGTVALFTAYDTVKKTWTNLPDMPAPRDHAGRGVVNNVLYVLGGRLFGHYNVQADVFSYNPKTNVWGSNLAKMPTPRGGCASTTIGGLIYTFGGEGDNKTTSGVYPQTEAYDVSKNKWTKLANMTRPVHGSAAATINGKAIIPGGGFTIGGNPTPWTSQFSP